MDKTYEEMLSAQRAENAANDAARAHDTDVATGRTTRGEAAESTRLRLWRAWAATSVAATEAAKHHYGVVWARRFGHPNPNALALLA